MGTKDMEKQQTNSSLITRNGQLVKLQSSLSPQAVEDLRKSKTNSKITISPGDLIDDKPLPIDFLSIEARIQACFGRTEHYNTVKYQNLWATILKKGWSKNRLLATAELFIEKVKFETWTIAEFLECDQSPVFFGERWMTEQLSIDVNVKTKMDIVLINGHKLYRFHDGLIFDHLNYIQINGKDIYSERLLLEKQLNDLVAEKNNLIDDYEEALDFVNKSEEDQKRYWNFINSLKLPPGAKKSVKDYPTWCNNMINEYKSSSANVDERITELLKKIQALTPH